MEKIVSKEIKHKTVFLQFNDYAPSDPVRRQEPDTSGKASDPDVIKNGSVLLLQKRSGREPGRAGH